jgi:hypothetical protein
MYWMRKSGFVLLLLLLPQLAEAQTWRGMRHEVYAGVGASNFLGDLGGARGVGSHNIKDIRMSATRPTIQLGYKFMLFPSLSLKGQYTWGILSGDDAKTKNPIRNNRNLSFRSFVNEISVMGQYFPGEERIHPRYKIRGVNGNKTFSVMPYFFVGVGVSFFNPKALYNGQWTALHPLHTEGQGMAGRPDIYKRVTVAFPFGAGLKYLITKQWAVSFELSLRYTLSDYIDDVSTSYYLPAELAAAYGQASADLSDRTLDPDLGWTGVIQYPNGVNNYLQRGDPKWNDAYMFAIFSVHYRINEKTIFIPKF